jgi:hypothetical protein
MTSIFRAWQHAGGGYGWVGPLFWPFAYNDMYDYTIWGDGLGFWGYGYPDIYAGIFGPYGYDGLSAYLPQRSQGRRHARGVPLDQQCGSDRREVAGLPVDQIADAVQPTPAQGAGLDELVFCATPSVAPPQPRPANRPAGQDPEARLSCPKSPQHLLCRGSRAGRSGRPDHQRHCQNTRTNCAGKGIVT